MHITRTDSGPETHLAVCSCGWRGAPTLDKLDASNQRATHEAQCHPGQDNARRADREARRNF